MDGFIIIDKPAGYTSFDICNIARKVLNTKRIGHLGTLDPLATGVLVIAVDDACKLVSILENDSKKYIAEIKLGILTDTFDTEGKIIENSLVGEIDNDLIDKSLSHFLGESIQTVPIYSAIKINGKKLYEYARKNLEVELPKRNILITDIKRISSYDNVNKTFSFVSCVSKGTYIRSLCVDIAKDLNTLGVMNNLRRIESGNFKIENSTTLLDFKNGNFKIINMLDALKDYPIIDDSKMSFYTNNGKKIPFEVIANYYPELPNRIVIAIDNNLKGIYDKFEFEYKVVRIWN